MAPGGSALGRRNAFEPTGISLGMGTVLTLSLGVGLTACRGPADTSPPAAPTPAPCARIGETCRFKPGVLGVCEPQGEAGALRCMPQH